LLESIWELLGQPAEFVVASVRGGLRPTKRIRAILLSTTESPKCIYSSEYFWPWHPLDRTIATRIEALDLPVAVIEYALDPRPAADPVAELYAGCTRVRTLRVGPDGALLHAGRAIASLSHPLQVNQPVDQPPDPEAVPGFVDTHAGLWLAGGKGEADLAVVRADVLQTWKESGTPEDPGNLFGRSLRYFHEVLLSPAAAIRLGNLLRSDEGMAIAAGGSGVSTVFEGTSPTCPYRRWLDVVARSIREASGAAS
jgi:hypothetical protein